MVKAKRIAGMILAACIALSALPAGALAAGEQDRQEAPQDVWTYPLRTGDIAQPLSAPAGASSDIVQVRVMATDRETGEKIPVQGASVDLYVGAERMSTSDPTDGDGFASVSLAGLSIEQRRNATVSARKVVSRGKAITGGDRDPLFSCFPKDASGEYYRYSLELHSETIDKKGNWLGAPIPVSQESNNVDIVFAIDATGSMSDEIRNVKNNIAAFSENLIDRGLNIRFSIIEYRDIANGEETIVHNDGGSHWTGTVDSVTDTLAGISVGGGGDNPETLLDALGYVADNSLMSWRSDAYRFAFVLTDASYKIDNNYGYSSLQQLTDALADMNVVTSVITSSSYQSNYQALYEGTGGIYANIYSSSFDEEMLSLSDSIVESVTREMELELSEPRLLANLSVCYFADDSTSRSGEYREAVQNMLNEYAHRVAETTDGHVLIDKVILFSTDNRLDFYDTDELASMADIRIETEEKDDGILWFNVQIHSNAYVDGFFFDDTIPVVYDKDNTQHFSNLKNGNELNGRSTFARIQLSGTEGAGWDNSMIDDARAYSTTVAHETGHYLFGFYDEYLNADDQQWKKKDKPYEAFGLMDNQHSDIEMSKDQGDYAYIFGSYSDVSSAPKDIQTAQIWNNKMSCESQLAIRLAGGITNSSGLYLISPGPYKSNYTKAPGGADRDVGYSYAGLSGSDYISVVSGGGGGGGGAWRPVSVMAPDDMAEVAEPLAEVAWIVGEDTVTVEITPDALSNYRVMMRKAGGSFDDAALASRGDVLAAELDIAKGDLAEVRVVKVASSGPEYNTYYVDRSDVTDVGYIYGSADKGTEAYVIGTAPESYTFIADNTRYTNGSWSSVSQATHIISDGGTQIESGEIYAVASFMSEIDYTSLSWFKYAGGVWTELPTDHTDEENMNIGARADLDGEGMYVLMAKAPTGRAMPAEDLHVVPFDPVNDRDATATMDFTDPNTGSKYYNVYYSETMFTGKNEDGVVVRSFYADDGTRLTLDLIERNRTVYAAVEIVLEDGSRSPLSDVILVSGEADSDGDGLPDWYCNKYLLWDKGDLTKPVADRDADGDGLTNLEEYQGGSDPTDPNDPVHTTNIPVASISVTPAEVKLAVGGQITVSATVQPRNATNKDVTWYTMDPGIASITDNGSFCLITAIDVGTTTVYAVTEDGGYSALISVTVGREDPFVDVKRGDWFYDAVFYGARYGLVYGTSPTVFSPYAQTTRAMVVTILYRFEKCPVVFGAAFDDVLPGAWYYDAVTWAAENGIVEGYGDGNFGPNDLITREQMATILFRYANYAGYSVSGSSGLYGYVDVNRISPWALAAMRWANAEGIITGRTSNTLVPGDPMTRAEAAEIIMRFGKDIAGMY